MNDRIVLWHGGNSPLPPFSTFGDHRTEMRATGPSRSAVQEGQRAACSLGLHVGSPHTAVSPARLSRNPPFPTKPRTHYVPLRPMLCKVLAMVPAGHLTDDTVVKGQVHPCHCATPPCLSFHFCKVGTVMLVLASYWVHSMST